MIGLYTGYQLGGYNHCRNRKYDEKWRNKRNNVGDILLSLEEHWHWQNENEN